MSDLIDRQALLKQIDIDSDGEPGYYGDTWKFIDTIKSMPPAELSTNLAEVGTDAISKQQAIDALKEHRALYCDNTPEAFSKLSHAEKSRVDELDTAIATLVNLPPAEPKRGKWIHHPEIGWGETWLCNQCGEKTTSTVMGKPRANFCPNCGAKMEAPE